MESLQRSKRTMGRRKIEMKKIQKKTSLQVTFTKRRIGLFRKAAELSVLCGSEVAMIVQSPANKVYAFGAPSMEHVLHRFDAGAGFIANYGGLGDDHAAKREYEEAVRMLEEKKMEKVRASTNGGICEENGFWWNRQIEGMELREVEEYLESLEDLRTKVWCRIEEMAAKQQHPTYSSPSSVSAAAVTNQGSSEDGFGGLDVQNTHNNDDQESEKIFEELDNGDNIADDAQMKKDTADDIGFVHSNLGTNMNNYSLDFDDLFFQWNYGDSSTSFNDVEAFLGGF